MALTDRAIKAAKPKDKPYKLADGNGMYLLVKPNGGKYWRFKYRWHGKEKLFAIGVYPDTTVKMARDKLKAARELLDQAIDPATHKKQTLRQAKFRADNSFEALAREWHETKKNQWTTKHAAQVLKSLKTEIFPDIGTRPVAEVTPTELLDVLRKIEKRGALEIASRVRQRCEAVFSCAIATGRANHNPATELKGVLKPPVQKNYAALSEKEFPKLLKKISKYQGNPETRLALRLLALTFVRTGELRYARWEEFDLERAEWRIPAERMKARDPHIVPLSEQALAVLKELQGLAGKTELLLPGRSNPRKPISENTLLYALYRMGYHTRATVHGFRATASTILNEMGFRPDVIERQLAHKERNKVRAAYNRAEYLAERREMMQQWADMIDKWTHGAKVVPFRRDTKSTIM